MIDRQPTKPNRVKLTYDDGTVAYAIMERADEPTVEGTPLNKGTLFNSNNSERYVANLPAEAFELLTNEPIVVVPSSGWSSEVDGEGYYTQQIDVEGMSKQYSPIFSPVLDIAENALGIENAFAAIKRIITYDGYIVLKSARAIESDISIRLKGV